MERKYQNKSARYLICIICFGLLILNAANIFAGDITGRINKKIILNKIDESISVDGIIDPIWSKADSVQDFIQYNPFFRGNPTQYTLAKILSTEDALYCLIISQDKTGNIEANKGTLDDWNGDGVTLDIDTYNDKRTAYEFAVSASGARADCRMLDDGRNKDYSWDGVWFAASKEYDWGYVAEFKIPYKSISYDKNLDEWGIDFQRWVPNNNEDIAWSNYEENEGVRVSKFGQLIFNNIKPASAGMNLEIYPVGLTNVTLQKDGKYKISPDAGLDVFYNPSPSLTYQLTVNPDFAQIEADPYSFNISRYESYFSERRPFFTQGNEIFTPSGKDRNSGFYSPLELFYSRRIGKKLPDGEEVPLLGGTKAFGRIGDLEYGGFLAMTGEEKYTEDGESKVEDRAVFGVARFKKQIFDNSTLGVMFVGKQTKNNFDGVLDIDGALRQPEWQLSYQFARSFQNNVGDYAFASGFMMFDKDKMILSRAKYIGDKFDISQVGYVPWKGTAEWTVIGGPRWFLEEGYIRQILLYGGFSLNYEKVDLYTDQSLILGYNMQFRDNWGFEINYSAGKSKDSDQKYNSYNINLSSWFNPSPKWSANLWGGFSKTYNFSRNYLASYMWVGTWLQLNLSKNFSIGASNNAWIERKPNGSVEDITFNTRPYVTFVPINFMNLKLYIDNVFTKSSQHLQSMVVGFLFSYNFLPKSWIYLAYNEVQLREEMFNEIGNSLSYKMHVTDRASVIKIKYLYYF
jgi:hypothetical protein